MDWLAREMALSDAEFAEYPPWFRDAVDDCIQRHGERNAATPPSPEPEREGGRRIVEGLTEAVAIARGETEPHRWHTPDNPGQREDG